MHRWREQLRRSLEPKGRRKRSASEFVRVRLLERRRVLDAAITSLIAPVVPNPVEGDTVTVAVEATGTGPIEFDWVIFRDSVVIETSTSQSFNFTAIEDGNYEARVLVTDRFDQTSDFGSMSFTVGNVDPTIETLELTAAPEGSTATLTGTLIDPGIIDTHTVDVDWGDGTPLESLVVTQGAGSASFVGSHIYADNGDYTVRVFAADDDGGTSEATRMISVGNVDPTLTVAPNQTVNEGATLSITNIGSITDPGFNNDVLMTVESFTYTINWGDGTAEDAGSATIDTVGDRGILTAASFDGAHIYADNGTYTVTVTVMDDDGGSDTKTFDVLVGNVDPILTGVSTPLSLDEGEIFSLASVGVGLSDPGFDNPLNAGNVANGGEVTETFTGTSINWGDGTVTTPLAIVGRVSGTPGVLTTAGFDHAPHAYADNGTYTVTVTFADDDGGSVARTFTIVVDNVAPTLTLTGDRFRINEGDTLTVANLGTFTDPGYDNALALSGQTQETFTYTIDWGDGTVETGQLPSGRTSGRQGVLTTGTLADSHRYLDNDADNLYTITVTLADDDGGTTTKSIDVEVLNVDPTLEPITATDVSSLGVTTLELSFSDPGADTFEVLVDWGDKLDLPPDARFVVETVHGGTTPASFVLTHTYAGPPDLNNPSADIVISVKIRDDDFGTFAVVTPGESNLEQVTITQPGIQDRAAVFVLTPEVGGLEFPVIQQQAAQIELTDSAQNQLIVPDVRGGGGDVSATSERFFEIRVVFADGEESKEGVRLKDEVLDNLPALFERLPDNHYRIYLVRTENNSRRLVIDIAVRDGRLVDPGDDSDGTRDRPPTIDEALDNPPQALNDQAADVEAAGTLPIPPSVREAIDEVTIDDVTTSEPNAPAGALMLAGTATTIGWREQLNRAFRKPRPDKFRKHRLRPR